jgi:hypothetical protein
MTERIRRRYSVLGVVRQHAVNKVHEQLVIARRVPRFARRVLFLSCCLGADHFGDGSNGVFAGDYGWLRRLFLRWLLRRARSATTGSGVLLFDGPLFSPRLGILSALKELLPCGVVGIFQHVIGDHTEQLKVKKKVERLGQSFTKVIPRSTNKKILSYQRTLIIFCI